MRFRRKAGGYNINIVPTIYDEDITTMSESIV